MKKIDLIELMDENGSSQKVDKAENWRDTLEQIKIDSNNFDLETMCKICIQQQYELGV